MPSFTPARVAPTRVAPTSVAPARVAAELGLPLAGLPRQGYPRQGDIALAGLPCQGSAPPHVAYSGIVHLLCDGPTHLVLFARWRGFVVLLYEVLFSCRAGLQVPYGPQMLEGPCQSSLLINCQGFPLVVAPARAPPGLPPPRLSYIYIYICRERNKKVFFIQKNLALPLPGLPVPGLPPPGSPPQLPPPGLPLGWPGLPRLALAILPYE